jgi:membrane protease YdiL (CAAX protease family)
LAVGGRGQMGSMAVGGVAPRISRDALIWWFVLTAALATLAYYAHFAIEDSSSNRDLLYSYGTAAAGAIQYAVMLGLALLIARGTDWRTTFALRRPASIRRAAWQTVLALFAIWVLGAALSPVLNAGEEQGFVPDEWRSDRAIAFAANAVVVGVVGPVIEELLFRGVGYTAVQTWLGTGAAVIITAVAFATAHGLVEGFPILVAFGVAIALLRRATGSVYPGIVLHCLFNGTALAVGVTLGNDV